NTVRELRLVRVQAVQPDLAGEGDRGVRVELLVLGAQRAERDAFSAPDLADVVFPRFPNIDQENFPPPIKSFFQLLDRDGEAHGATLLCRGIVSRRSSGCQPGESVA